MMRVIFSLLTEAYVMLIVTIIMFNYTTPLPHYNGTMSLEFKHIFACTHTRQGDKTDK